MASWKKENTVLTNRGNEILSLVSSGVGRLTVTRISSGSGFTPLTNLKGLTDLNTHRQDLELVRTQLSENGSVLSVRLSNEELTEAYNLSQLGVFVTHTNFSGEQLYMIAQCEQGSADFIPLPSDSRLTVNYSLSLVHGPVENLEITVTEALPIRGIDYWTAADVAAMQTYNENYIENYIDTVILGGSS